MATTQQNTPRGILSGLFGPKFLDDPEAIAGIAQSLGVGSGGASPQPGTSPSPAGPNSPAGQNPAQAGPVSGVVPKSFAEWHADPVNVAKIPAPVSDAPLPTADQGWHPPMLPPEQLQQQQPVIQSAPAAAPAPDSSAVPPSGVFPTSGVFPNRADWLKANPVQVQGAPKPLAGTKKSFLGMALATLGDNIGAALSGGRPMVGSEWMKNVQDIRDYDRNLPVLKQQAENQAYSTALQQEQEKAGITHLQAQTAMLQQSPTPFTKAVGDTRADIENLWKSGSLSEQDFDKQIQLKMGALPPGVARNITPEYLSSVKRLPQQPPSFKAGPNGIEPITYRGQSYGITPVQGEPPEITQARKLAIDSQTQNESSKQALKAGEFPPVVVARLGKPPLGDAAAMAKYGRAAQEIMTSMSADPKIAAILAGISAQNKNNPSALSNVAPHLVAPATAAYEKAGADYAAAYQAAKNMSDFLAEAKSGNKEAVKMVPLQGALEITTAQGVHRINRTEVDQFGGAGSLLDRIEGKLGGIVSGKDIPDSVLNDMQKLQQTVSQNATQLHRNKVAVINRTYGSQFEPMSFDNQPNSQSPVKVGGKVKLKNGTTVTVTAVHPDGSFDAN